MARIILDTSEEAVARDNARLRERALHDEASLMRQATEKGVAIGEKRGKEQGRTADMIVFHQTGGSELAPALNWYLNPNAQ